MPYCALEVNPDFRETDSCLEQGGSIEFKLLPNRYHAQKNVGSPIEYRSETYRVYRVLLPAWCGQMHRSVSRKSSHTETCACMFPDL